ncbi:zinc ribbon domain-containing protein [Comamonas testosteroni]|uniref:Zinc ribbon domain-containing protein n=1 Tax=Comamonas testosteroni TaxID=285 RepID=A0A373FB35_COMTE|nr:zinc ribbon domain-containing protein [Comamonas testosteroni]RGE41177.1 zinc ribbon domain-containing protein [Comamonas testosteroni]
MKQVQSLGEIRFGTLARAAEGLTQWRPLLLGFLTLLLTGALMWLGQWMAIKVAAIMALVMMVLAFVVMMAGFSGVGIMLMDKAKNQPVRSFAAAASAGLLCLPKFLLISLVMTLAFITYMIVAAIVYFVCKIPFVGGIVAFVAHPILVLSFAAVLVALIWVVGPLMAPALWSGLPVKAAIANVLAIARKRLVEVVLMEVLLYIILSLIGVLLFAGLVPASFSLTGLGISIMGDSNAMMAMAMSGMGRGGMSPMVMMGAGGNTWGLMAGLGVLYCVVGALLTQVAIMGMNLIYLQARENLNPADAEGALDDFMGDMRKKAAEAKDLARQAAQDMAAKKDSSDAAPGSTPAGYQPTSEQSQPSVYGAAAAGVAGVASGSTNASPSADQTTSHETLTREQAQAAEKARIAAEEEAARQRTEAEVARVRAEAEAARQRADALAAEQAARDRAAAEAEAAARARAEEQAAAERAAREQAQAQAQIAAEEARRRAEAEAAERAARERAEQERMEREKAEHERAQAQAAAQAAEQARQREEAQAQARQRAEEQAREQARLQAEREAAQREAAEREAARAKAQAEAEEKARLAAAKTSCPSCHAHVSPDDMFCGECGHKLK